MKRFLLICSLVLATATGAFAAGAPTDDDRRAFAGGVASWQLIDMLEDRRSCGIVLLRARCAAVVAGIPGGDEKIAAFAASGDSDLYDKTWAQANDVQVGDAEWKANPRATWLRVAGIVWQASYDPFHVALFDVLKYGQLASRASDAGPAGELVPQHFRDVASAAVSKGSKLPLGIDEISTLQKVLQPAFTAMFPVPAQPAVEYASGTARDRQLGVYFATASEMFENPQLFTQPQSRAFLSAFATSLGREQNDPKSVALATDLSGRFLTIEGPEAWRTAAMDLAKLQPFQAPSDPERATAFLYGTMSTQLAYNGAVLHELAANRAFLGVLGQQVSAERGDPILAEKRRALLAVVPTDMHAVNAAASALVLALMQSGPHPASSSSQAAPDPSATSR